MSQFSNKIRHRYLNLHRLLGKIYVTAVLCSGSAALYIAFFATGGIICSTGFGLFALLWLITDIKAYTSIRRLDIVHHENWMIRNYALTFAAVTLRIMLPAGQSLLHLEFISVYRFVAWFCWIPNLLFAEWLIRKKRISGMVDTSGTQKIPA